LKQTMEQNSRPEKLVPPPHDMHLRGKLLHS